MKKTIAILLVLLLTLSLFGCGTVEEKIETTEAEKTKATTEAEKTTATTAETTESSTEADVEEGYLVGQRALDFELQDKNGNAIKLSDFRGKTVVLNFFATWCGPCQVETPHLNETYLDMQDDDVVVLSVNLTFSRDGEKDAVKDFINEYDVAFPVVLDETGEVAESYRIRSIPTNIFIKPNGIIDSSYSGALNKESFVEMINEAKASE